MPRGLFGAAVGLSAVSAAVSVVLVGGIGGLLGWVDCRADSIAIGRA
jgi:hypothetical protein